MRQSPPLLSGLVGDSLEFRVISGISRVLVGQRELAGLLEHILQTLEQNLGFSQGALCLLQGDELIIEASYGLSEEEKARGTYHLGEGITGEVGRSGKPAIIRDTAHSRGFLNRTGALHGDMSESFLCVPVLHSGEIIGTLSLSFPVLREAVLEKLLRLLEVVANILADAVASVRAQVNERQQLERENDRMRYELGENQGFENIIGHSSAMRSVYLEMAKVARSTANVLLLGESGTGKELLAQAIHYASDRRSGPFVAVNCAALPEGLIESELFGHEKGAFTGAIKQRIGRFEEASEGTLFLDEIGDIPVQTQVKLLRVLQEKIFERVGSQQPLRTNARIIAATSRNLEKMKDEGSFREDLYYRLAVLPIAVPPLRSRKVDIISLADFFLTKYNKRYNKHVLRLSTPAIDMLMSYHWPGNVRELENMIERAVIMSNSSVINAVDLPPSLQTAQATGTENILPDHSDAQPGAALEVLTAAFETELITAALKRTKGNVSAAARELSTTIRKLNYRIRQLHISPAQYR
ncbi:MAG: sigma 54-interacting transcriptional regulator [Akkermansia sp.]